MRRSTHSRYRTLFSTRGWRKYTYVVQICAMWRILPVSMWKVIVELCSFMNRGCFANASIYAFAIPIILWFSTTYMVRDVQCEEYCPFNFHVGSHLQAVLFREWYNRKGSHKYTLKMRSNNSYYYRLNLLTLMLCNSENCLAWLYLHYLCIDVSSVC